MKNDINDYLCWAVVLGIGIYVVKHMVDNVKVAQAAAPRSDLTVFGVRG